VSDGSGDTPRILVSNRQPILVEEAALVGLARACLSGEGLPRSELSVSFVTPDEIAGLHERYLAEAGPTDVLSFPLDEDDRDEEGVRVLGDVVIAPEVAARNNPDDPTAEVRLLLVHGILHLLGHDHEEEDARRAMWALQERYTGVSIP
jgi:probable rRNA maturation factor